jgi:lipopolysaccharide/colanic/teichoic acid biosynthesis glycosyltransferase
MARRTFEIVVAGAALLCLAFPLALVALAVKLTSSGPVLYRQPRVGRGGRLFCLYKFRTMQHRATGAQVTVATDSRITAVGSWLRRFKIDEVPQLWNVLRGDMRVLGPRPEVERFVRHYGPAERPILDFTPGLASRAQVVYPHEASLLRVCADPEAEYVRSLMPRKIAVDLEYERIRTFWSDLALIGELALLVVGKSYRMDTNLRIDAVTVASPAPAEKPQSI